MKTPIHKNWKAICELGRKDHGLMFVIAGMSNEKLKNDIGQRLISAFPECFSEKPVGGPIPWSYFLQCAEKSPMSPDCDPEDIRKNPVHRSDIFGKFGDDLPPHVIYMASNCSYRLYPEYPRWPAKLSKGVRIGDEVAINGGEWVVVDHYGCSDDEEEIVVMPKGSIDFKS